MAACLNKVPSAIAGLMAGGGSDKMGYLLKETVGILADNDKQLSDVAWFGTKECRIDCDIELLLSVEYDSGYGSHEVPLDFIIVGHGWWLERHEYDGSEWWEFKTMPLMPSKVIEQSKLKLLS